MILRMSNSARALAPRAPALRNLFLISGYGLSSSRQLEWEFASTGRARRLTGSGERSQLTKGGSDELGRRRFFQVARLGAPGFVTSELMPLHSGNIAAIVIRKLDQHCR